MVLRPDLVPVDRVPGAGHGEVKVHRVGVCGRCGRGTPQTGGNIVVEEEGQGVETHECIATSMNLPSLYLTNLEVTRLAPHPDGANLDNIPTTHG